MSRVWQQASDKVFYSKIFMYYPPGLIIAAVCRIKATFNVNYE